MNSPMIPRPVAPSREALDNPALSIAVRDRRGRVHLAHFDPVRRVGGIYWAAPLAQWMLLYPIDAAAFINTLAGFNLEADAEEMKSWRSAIAHDDITLAH